MSKMENFEIIGTIVNGFYLSTIVANLSILDICGAPGYAFAPNQSTACTT